MAAAGPAKRAERALGELAEVEQGAAHVVRLTTESPRVAPVPMEPRAVLAWFTEATGTYEIRCSHQGGGVMSGALATMLGVPREQVRVNRVDVGGAFGPRGAPYAEYAVLLHAARKLGRPINWVSTRSEVWRSWLPCPKADAPRSRCSSLFFGAARPVKHLRVNHA